MSPTPSQIAVTQNHGTGRRLAGGLLMRQSYAPHSELGPDMQRIIGGVQPTVWPRRGPAPILACAKQGGSHEEKGCTTADRGAWYRWLAPALDAGSVVGSSQVAAPCTCTF